MTNPPPELLTVGQVAEELRISPRAVLNRIQSGRLPATRFGTGRTSPWMVRADDVRKATAA